MASKVVSKGAWWMDNVEVPPSVLGSKVRHLVSKVASKVASKLQLGGWEMLSCHQWLHLGGITVTLH